MTDQPIVYDPRAWATYSRDAKCGCTAPDPADCAIPHPPSPWMCPCHYLSIPPAAEELAAVQAKPTPERPTETLAAKAARLDAALPAPTVQATAYRVSLLPEDDVNFKFFVLTVEYRGEGRWAVTNGDACLGADGTWADGVKPYGRGDEWIAAHRFDLDTALRLAQDAAPHVIVNGRTAADAYRLTVGEA